MLKKIKSILLGLILICSAPLVLASNVLEFIPVEGGALPAQVYQGAQPLTLHYQLVNHNKIATFYNMTTPADSTGQAVVIDTAPTTCVTNGQGTLTANATCDLYIQFTAKNVGKYDHIAAIAKRQGDASLELITQIIQPAPPSVVPLSVALTGEIAQTQTHVQLQLTNNDRSVQPPSYSESVLANGQAQLYRTAGVNSGTYTANSSITVNDVTYNLKSTVPFTVDATHSTINLEYDKPSVAPVNVTVSIDGALKSDAPAYNVAVTLTGPGTYTNNISGNTPYTFNNVMVGTYSVAPTSVNTGSGVYDLVTPQPLVIDSAHTNIVLTYKKATPTDYHVKGWSDTYITMASISEGTSNPFNWGKLQERLIPKGIPFALFRYTDAGGADTYNMSPPYLDVSSQKLIKGARELESTYAAKYGSFETIMPTIAVYTSCASCSTDAMNIDFGLDPKYPHNLEWRLADLIILAHYLESTKDAQHPVPATLVINPDFLGEVHKIENGAYAPFDINNLNLKLLSALQAAYVDAHAVNSDITIPTSYPAEFTDAANINAYLDAINWVIKSNSPDVAFGWMDNVWAGDVKGHLWLHHPEELTAHVQAETTFLQSLHIYDKTNPWRPDFLAFDKYERDNLGDIPNNLNNGYTYNIPAWKVYFGFISGINTVMQQPIMLFQLPGGHIQLQGDIDTRSNHGSTAPDFIFGDSKLNTDFSNVANYIAALNFADAKRDYNFSGGNVVINYLKDTQGDSWQQNHLADLSSAHVFSILWGGGTTTSYAGMSAERDDNGWLYNKITTCYNNNQCKR